jgi:hypothetical protein
MLVDWLGHQAHTQDVPLVLSQDAHRGPIQHNVGLFASKDFSFGRVE